MPLAREKYDGNIVRRNYGHQERRDTVDSKSTPHKHALSKRSEKYFRFLNDGIPTDSEGGEKDRYLITYSDVITLLLGLFIILYAISNIDLKKYEKFKIALENSFGNTGNVINVIKKDNPADLIQEDKLKNHLMQIINENGYSNSISLEENKRGLIIHIMDKILFTSGDADLSTESEKVLIKISSILNQVKNDVRVEGHTDNVPINNSKFASNWHLSVARALNTAYFLIKDEGLQPERVSIVGYAEYKPIASNGTPGGRAQNRRVDIVIIKNKS